MALRMLSLFSGIGGIDLAARWAGIETVAFCEIEKFCQQVLAKHWPGVPIFDDVTKLTAESLRRAGIDRVDIIAGGFPCQDVSDAGKREGIEGARSGLWAEFKRIAHELRPGYILIENVSGLLDRGMWRILADLAAIGFDAEWQVLRACDFGAPHERERLFIVAYPSGERPPCFQVFRTGHAENDAQRQADTTTLRFETFRRTYPSVPEDLRMDDGIPIELDEVHARMKALGNSVDARTVFPIFEAIVEHERAAPPFSG